MQISDEKWEAFEKILHGMAKNLDAVNIKNKEIIDVVNKTNRDLKQMDHDLRIEIEKSKSDTMAKTIGISLAIAFGIITGSAALIGVILGLAGLFGGT